ncbi:MAG: TlpA family protein disulfide reductase [Chitinophagaceae bacterium]|nr:MAG: TlpA family protein disulfide reductase [Chitinophagaceae bacterium]
MPRLLLLLSCFFTSLLPAAAQGGKVRIEGSLSGVAAVRNVQLMYPNGVVLAGPVPVKDGRWTLQCRIPQPRLALVSFLSEVPVNASPEAPVYRYNVPLFLTPGTVTVETSGALAASRVGGSEATDDYLRLQAAAAPYEEEIQRWRALAGDSALAGNLPQQVYIGRKIDSLAALCRERVYGRFLERNIASPLVPHVLGAYWHLDGEPDRMLRFLVNMPWRYRYPYINAFRDELQVVARVWTGQDAPDFQLRDTAGQAVQLSALRGRYVLIHFWSVWNVLSREEHPNLAEAYRYFAPRNLTLLGVALARRGDESLWRKAIRSDSLRWTQLLDTKFWNSPVAKKYAIQSVPQNVLVDPAGKIVARNLSGEHLWAVLDRLLPQ